MSPGHRPPIDLRHAALAARSARVTGLVSACLLLSACTGTIGDTLPGGSAAQTGASAASGAGGANLATGMGGSSGSEPLPMAPGTAGTPGTDPVLGPVSPGGITIDPVPLRRLTNSEYDSTLRDLFKVPITVSAAATFPADDGYAGYRSGRSMSETHAERLLQAAETVAAQAVADLKSLLPCDPASAGEAACASQFIRSFGARAFRRPLDEAQGAALDALYTTVRTKYDFSAGIEAVLQALLQSPQFLYHLELEELEKGAGALVAVTGHSMASRLSYLMWGSMPDAALFEAAAQGLTSPAEIRAQAERLAGDQRARAGFQSFSSQWLDTERVSEVRKEATAFATFDAATAQALRESVDRFVAEALWAPSRGLETLLGGDTVEGHYAYVNARIAPLFGVSSSSATLEKVPIDAGVRRGLLTHPALLALLATPSFSHPIKRGVYVLHNLLCMHLEEPAFEIPAFEAPEPGLSVRQQFEKLTEPAPCQGCHTIINPIGFALERFDAVGAARTTDDAKKPLNLAGIVAGVDDVDGPVQGPLELIARLAVSPRASACLTEQLYTYATKHFVNATEKPVLTQLGATYTAANQSIAALLVATTQTEAFLSRRNGI